MDTDLCFTGAISRKWLNSEQTFKNKVYTTEHPHLFFQLLRVLFACLLCLLACLLACYFFCSFAQSLVRSFILVCLPSSLEMTAAGNNLIKIQNKCNSKFCSECSELLSDPFRARTMWNVTEWCEFVSVTLCSHMSRACALC